MEVCPGYILILFDYPKVSPLRDVTYLFDRPIAISRLVSRRYGLYRIFHTRKSQNKNYI